MPAQVSQYARRPKAFRASSSVAAPQVAVAVEPEVADAVAPAAVAVSL